MNKIILLLTGIVLVTGGCRKAEYITPFKDTYRLERSSSYSSSTATKPYGMAEYEYDADNNLIKKSLFDYPDILSVYWTYSYEGGKKVEEKTYAGQVGNLALQSYIRYLYSGENLVKEELFLADGTLKQTTHYEYSGSNMVRTYLEDDRGIHHEYKYTFDNHNRLIFEESSGSYSMKYYYDNKGRLAKKETYDNKGEMTSYMENVYSENGNLPVKELYFNTNQEFLSERQLIYDNHGNLTETIVVRDGMSNSLFKRKYMGRLLTEDITYASNWGWTEWAVVRYEYARIH